MLTNKADSEYSTLHLRKDVISPTVLMYDLFCEMFQEVQTLKLEFFYLLL